MNFGTLPILQLHFCCDLVCHRFKTLIMLELYYVTFIVLAFSNWYDMCCLVQGYVLSMQAYTSIYAMRTCESVAYKLRQFQQLVSANCDQYTDCMYSNTKFLQPAIVRPK